MPTTRSFRSISRIAWRHAKRRPWQSFFFVVGVAIGVAMIVAIDLANGSAARAFNLGAEAVAGRTTHQIVGGPTGLDERVYTDLRRELGYRLSAPIVENYVVAPQLDGQPLRLLGVDPFAEPPFRSYLGTAEQDQPTPDFLSDMLVRPNSVLLSTAVATRYGFDTGDLLDIRIGSRSQSLEIIGLMEPSDDLSRRALDGLLVTDIATAQEVLNRVGRIDRIDLILPEGEAAASVRREIETLLPPGARLDVAAGRSGAINEMTAAFSLNLTALSLLALVVGIFLIYNAVTFSVVQRRAVLGSLRALGMTGREIYAMILLEAAILGLLGTVLGLVLGVVLGRGAVELVTRTMNDLFFVVAVREVDVPIWTLVKGLVIGIAAALLGAAVPAFEAISVPPAGALKRSNVEERVRRVLPWVTVGAVVLLALGAAMLIPEWNLVITFTGLFAVIIGFAMLTPAATLGLMHVVGRLVRRHGIIQRMAPRTVTRSLSRTSVAVAALMVAVSVIIGVGVMISSFRNTVVQWLDDVLQADIFVSPPSLSSNVVTDSMTPTMADQLGNVPGVLRVATTRGVDIAAFLSEHAEALDVRLVALSDDIAGPNRRYRDSVGDWRATWESVRAGGIVINEPMHNRYDVNVGDSLTLQTDRGPQSFPVVGVSIDFDVNAVVFMHDPVYRQYWDDEGISAVGLFVAEDVDVDATVAQIRSTLAGEAELLVQSNRATRANALEVFDRTFAITVALQLLATIVAFIGILSTLMSLQLERTREIGVLRANGMTRRQLWRLSLLETGLIGTSAGLIAIPTGLVLAVVLIYIINLRSFGWTLQMQLQAGEFVQAFLVALGAALLAGLYPAWRIGNIQPADAVRTE